MAGDGDEVAAGALQGLKLLVEVLEVGVGIGLNDGYAELGGDRFHQGQVIFAPLVGRFLAVV